MIEVTDHDNERLFLNIDAVVSIKEREDGSTIELFNGEKTHVIESYESIMNKWDKANEILLYR